jgi:hypothetical protein
MSVVCHRTAAPVSTHLDVGVCFDGLKQGFHCIFDVVPRAMAGVFCEESDGVFVLLAGRDVA